MNAKTADHPAPASRAGTLAQRLARLDRVRAAHRAAASLLAAFAGTTITFLLFSALDPALNTPPWARALVLSTLVAAAFAVVIFNVGVLLKRPSPHAIAVALDHRLGPEAPRIRAAAELLKQSHAPGSTAEHLARRAAQIAATMIPAEGSALHTALAPERRLLARAGIAACSVSTGAALLAILAPGLMRTASARLWSPFADIPPYSSTILRLELVTAPTPGGEALVRVRTQGEHPPSVTVRIHKAGDADESRTILADPDRALHAGAERSFLATIRGVHTPLRITAHAGRARSVALTIMPETTPRLIRAALRISPPPYTGLPAQSLPIEAHAPRTLHAPEGSALEWIVTTTTPLHDDDVASTPGAMRQSLPASDGVSSVAYTARATINAQTRFTSAMLGLDTRVIAVADSEPTLAWIELESAEPSAASFEPLDSPRELRAAASDDHPLAGAAFLWALIDAETGWVNSSFQRAEMPDRAKSATIASTFSGSLIGARTGDTLLVWAVAQESRPDSLGGSRQAHTPVRRFRLIEPHETPRHTPPTQPGSPELAASSSEPVSRGEPEQANPLARMVASPSSSSQEPPSNNATPRPTQSLAMDPERPPTSQEPDGGLERSASDAPSSASAHSPSGDGRLIAQSPHPATSDERTEDVRRARPGLVWRTPLLSTGRSPSIDAAPRQDRAQVPLGERDLVHRYFELLARSANDDTTNGDAP